MSKITRFEFLDDFDPLEDDQLVDTEQIEEESFDYQPPIPDADKSIVPEAIELTADEAIEKLLRGIPGQATRILSVVKEFEHERGEAEGVDAAEEKHPRGRSVYTTTRYVQLLEEAGALRCTNIAEREQAIAQMEAAEEQLEAAGTAIASQLAEDPDEQAASIVIDTSDALTIPEIPERRYVATQEGLDAYKRHINVRVITDLFAAEPQYQHVYEGLLERANADEGSNVKQLDEFVEADPVTKNPQRFSGYFIDRLEKANALVFTDAWHTTELGREALAAL